MKHLRHHLVAGVGGAALTLAAAGQVEPDERAIALPEAVSIEVDSPPSAVTAYLGRASITRSFERAYDAGLYTLTFSNLPETVNAESIQARVMGPARVIAVEYEERPTREIASPRIAELERRIREAEDALAESAGAGALITTQEEFLDALAARAATTTTERTGTPRLDLEAVGEQLRFLTSERTRLVTERRNVDTRAQELEATLEQLRAEREALAGSTLVRRDAVVTLAVPTSATVRTDLVYLVANATWAPAYAIRATPDGTQVFIEYDAIFSQRTGEDWTGVQLTLSTALPARAANPPGLEPWFVDELDAAQLGSLRAPSLSAAPSRTAREAAATGFESTAGGALERIAADATVSGTGPAITYELPRVATVLTNARKQQRTRIAIIDAPPRFTHVALPLLTQSVYVRGNLTNTSAYQLLPGTAAIFVGSDYVGPTRLDAVAPGSPFEVFFGVDRTVTATRLLVSKSTAKTGLLGGGRKTSYDYRIEIGNGAGKTITLELWDRIPVSRSERVEIQLLTPSDPLATDAEYAAEDQPRGLLKWNLSIPPGAVGPNAYVVTYGLSVARPKDVEITALPE